MVDSDVCLTVSDVTDNGRHQDDGPYKELHSL
jgi:hypothetical protein